MQTADPTGCKMQTRPKKQKQTEKKKRKDFHVKHESFRFHNLPAVTQSGFFNVKLGSSSIKIELISRNVRF